MALSSPSFVLFDGLRAEPAIADVQALIQQIIAGKAAPAWSFVDGLLLHEGRVFCSSQFLVLAVATCGGSWQWA